jgi:two-component system CheB/CheR fusion protein
MTTKRTDQHPDSQTIADDVADQQDETTEGAAFPIVGVGASAGGLAAFTELLKDLPLDTGMGFVLVQHLDPVHESALTQILARATSLPVHEAKNNLRVEANHIYVIPPNVNLGIVQGVLKTQPRQKSRTPPRSIDFFFEALARDQRQRAIGIILSGTASDGTLGLEAIKAEGGITFAQDDSAKYDSMPHSAVAAGCVDFVLSPANMATELARIAKHPYIAGQPGEPLNSAEDDQASAKTHQDDETLMPSGGRKTRATRAKQARAAVVRGRGEKAERAENGFKKIFLLLRNHFGVDFSLYKSTTIRRRISRRMVLNQQETPGNYADFLRGNTKELDALYSDVLISVTSFFRNPAAFDVLKHKVFPKLLQQRGDDPFRVWVIGCSTGQEAYSIAMAFVEAAEKSPRMHSLQVFATDLNDAPLDKARRGLYAKSLVADVSPERLRRFFVQEDGGYRVNKSLREMVVFARQNLISDPPFSRMDLISCRNLLIYLEPSVQKKAFPTFHYALKPEGFLFLGASESIGNFTTLFEVADKKHKIYSKKPALTLVTRLPVKRAGDEYASTGQKLSSALPLGQGEVLEGFRAEHSAEREADRVTVNQFAPPGVLINADLQILQFRGSTGAYLVPPIGKASFDVLKMACEGLMLPLRAAINKAKKENKTARQENVRVEHNGTTATVNLEVIPLKNLKERCFLILFEDAETAERAGDSASPPQAIEPRAGPRAVGLSAKEESRRIAELETDLAETRDYLQSIQEQYEASNEELQAANEEVQSANEELQSLNEELETSAEELESSNEELATINEEMANRNAELNRLNSDLVNLQTSTKLAIVLLGRDLTIRRFSAQAEKQFNLLATDVGRPISNIRHNLVFEERRPKAASASTVSPRQKIDKRKLKRPAGHSVKAVQSPPDLESFIAEVITDVREREREVRDKEGRWYSLCVRPYMTLDNKVDGAVLVLLDIDALKRSEQAIAAARDYAEAIVHTTRDPLLILDADLRVQGANEAFYSTFKVSATESKGRLIYDLGNGQWNIPKLRTLLEDIVPRNSFFNNFEVMHDFESLGRRTMLLNARMLKGGVGQSVSIMLGIQDITELIHFQAEMRRSEQRYRRLFEAAQVGVLIIDPTTHKILNANPFITELLGYTHRELLDKELFEIGLLKDESACRAVFKELQTKGCHRYEDLPIETKAGERLEVEMVSNLYSEDGAYVIQCNIRDIGDRVRFERDREAMLANEQASRMEAEAANRSKDLFLATLSHEVRTPLNAILGWASILRSGKCDAADMQEGMEVIERNCKAQAQLIEDVLDVSRITSGKLQLQIRHCELVEVINAAIDVVRPAADAKDVRIETTFEPTANDASCDANRMQQVVWNLLSNAVKFSPQGGTVRVTLARNCSTLRIQVSDEGQGIGPEFLPYVFDRFRQADSSTRRTTGGLGLGLSIVKHIVEVHGGTVHAESEGEGRGATFTVNLPIRAVQIDEGEDKAEESDLSATLDLTPVRLDGLRVLVVDDEADARRLLDKVLSDAGALVTAVGSVAEALEAVATTNPQVLVSDIAMPGQDGYDLIRQVRGMGLTAKELPAVALTAFAHKEDRRRVLLAGYQIHVTKPVDPHELTAVIASLAGRTGPPVV